MKKLILPATIAAIMATAPLAATADVKLSGQINRMIAQVDNGVDSEIQHLDNDGSGTRIRLKGETDNDGIKVGFYWETQYDESNESSKTDADQFNDFDDSFETRHRDIYIKGDFGKVSIGQGNGAANGITEYEYTGTTFLTGYASPEDIWGGVTFTDNGTSTGVTVGDVVDGMDGLSRNDRLRYDSPKLGPVTVSVDMGQGSKTEIALRFDTTVPGGKLKGGIASWDKSDAGGSPAGSAGAPGGTAATGDEGMAGSIAYIHNASGFNAAYSFGELTAVGGAPDPENSMIILGWQPNPVHSLSLRLGTTDDKIAGESVDSTGIGYVNRSLNGAEFYAGYQLFEDGSSGATTDDITIVFAGVRVKF